MYAYVYFLYCTYSCVQVLDYACKCMYVGTRSVSDEYISSCCGLGCHLMRHCWLLFTLHYRTTEEGYRSSRYCGDRRGFDRRGACGGGRWRPAYIIYDDVRACSGTSDCSTATFLFSWVQVHRDAGAVFLLCGGICVVCTSSLPKFESPSNAQQMRLSTLQYSGVSSWVLPSADFVKTSSVP